MAGRGELDQHQRVTDEHHRGDLGLLQPAHDPLGLAGQRRLVEQVGDGAKDESEVIGAFRPALEQCLLAPYLLAPVRPESDLPALSVRA